MCGINKQVGFSLIELMVVIMLLGIVATIVVPSLQRRTPLYERQQFVTSLNALAQSAWQRAIQFQKVHRVYFDFEHHYAQVQVATATKDAKNQVIYEPVAPDYQMVQYTLPERFVFTAFSINGVNEMTSGKQVRHIWFYVVPDGMAQEVVINVADTADQDAEGNDRQIGLVLNPFTVQFKSYDRFQKA